MDIRKRILCSVIAVLVAVCPAAGQSIELLGGNALNGAINGVALGGATMALRNSNDFGPLRVGVGGGTLYGIGVGVYDISKVSKGEQFYISGTFNDGNNSTIIVLLDTMYGAAAGAVISTSFALIAKEPIPDGLRYGGGIGAWLGFGFGLFDSFVLAERPGDFASPPQAGGSGLITVTGREKRYALNLVNPSWYSFAEIKRRSVAVRNSYGIDLVRLHMTF